MLTREEGKKLYPEVDVNRDIDLNGLLYGKGIEWKVVVAFFARGEFHEEHYCVEAIEKYLLTEEQRKLMFDNRLTIEKILNGQFCDEEDVVNKIMSEWNEKLGFECFGF